MKAKKLACAIAAAAGLLAAAPYAISSEAAAPEAAPAAAMEGVEAGVVVATAPGQGAAVGSVVVTATITAIKKETREVTLRVEEGNEMTIVCGEEVRNFDQLAVGDTVTMAYLRALTLDLKKGDKQTLTMKDDSSLERAQPGEKPGGMMTKSITVLADVVKVDNKAKTITLRGPKGNQVELDIKDPEQLANIKVGDQVEATYTEAVAVSVVAAEKPAKKDKKKAKKDKKPKS